MTQWGTSKSPLSTCPRALSIFAQNTIDCMYDKKKLCSNIHAIQQSIKIQLERSRSPYNLQLDWGAKLLNTNIVQFALELLPGGPPFLPSFPRLLTIFFPIFQ